MTIYFDMDGTLSDLYGIDNWLELLRAYDPTPYAKAKPLLNLNVFARILNKLQKQGYKIGVISWLSKCSTPDYDAAVTAEKKKWLATHLKSVQFDEIHIVEYGFPKQMFVTSVDDILFDDEEKNRINWTGKAFDVDNIIEILKGI